MSKGYGPFYAQMQDSELIKGLRNGSSEAFKKLIELHQVSLIRLCKGFLPLEDDVQDIVQETFIEVFESISRFREDARLSTWIYRIAVNKSLNLMRKTKSTVCSCHAISSQADISKPTRSPYRTTPWNSPALHLKTGKKHCR